MQVCKMVLYRGHVQGVGFRMTAHRIAQRHRVAGYVRNLPDGRVELLAQGEPDELARLLEAIAARMSDFIRETEIIETAPGDYVTFEIRV